MAILFFDLNTPLGGAAAMTVTADNGLTTVDVGTTRTIELGGDLIKPTTILLNGQFLFINGSDLAGNSSTNTFEGGDTTLNAKSATAQFFLQINSANATLQSNNLDNTSLASVIVIPTDITTSVTDNVITDFANIHTNILGTQIKTADGVNGSSTTFFHADEVNISVNDLVGDTAAIDIFSGQIDLDAKNAGNDRSHLQMDTGSVIIDAIRGADNLSKGIELGITGGVGVLISDAIDNIGLQGDVLFPPNGNDFQYMQAGNVAVTSAKNDLISQVVSLPANVTFLVGAADAMFLLSAYTFFRLGAGNIQVTATYTDPLGNPATQTVGTPCTLAAPHGNNFTFIIKAKSGTAINLNWIVTGAATYDAGGAIQLLGT